MLSTKLLISINYFININALESVQEIFNSVNVPVKFEQIPLLEFKDIDQARKNEQEV